MNAPAACLFDLDGLLLDTEPCHARAWREAALQFGLRLEDAQLLSLRGRRRHDCVAQVQAWLEQSGRVPPSAADLLAVQQPIARRLLPDAPAMLGAPQLIERCDALRLPMALVTSSSSEAVAFKAAGHPWLERIELRIHGDDPALAAGKPAPDPFLLAAERLGVPASACWAFEDSPAGARAAGLAGCQVHVLLPPEIKEEERRRLYDPHWRFLNSLEDLLLELPEP
jgi:pseudouridine-5'-monophosphatase